MRYNTIANAFGLGWSLLMGVAFLPFYVRFLGVEAFGLIGVFAVIQAWLMLLDAGITPAMIRETSRLIAIGEHRAVWQVLRTSEILGAGAGAFSFVVMVFVALFMANAWLETDQLSTSVITYSFVLMGVVIAARFVENIYRAALIGLEQQVRLNVLICVVATVRHAGAAMVLIFVSRSVLAFFVWQMVVSVLAVGALAAASYVAMPGSAPRVAFSFKTLQRIWRFSVATFLISVFGTLMSQTDKAVLSAILPLSEFGYYAFAATVAAYVRMLAQPVYLAAYPRIVALTETREQGALAELYHLCSQVSTVLLSSVGVWLAAFGQPVMELWTQDAYLAARVAPILALLLLGFVINGFMNGPYFLQMAHGWTSLLLRINFCMAVLITPVILLAVNRFGMMGAASAWVLVNLVYLIVGVRLMHRRILPQEMGRWYLQDVLLPLAATGAAAVLFRQFIPLPETPLLQVVLLAMALGVCVAAAILAAPMVRSRALAALSHA